MRLKSLELNGFKSFHKKTTLEFQNSIVAIVGPNGSGKSNVVEALRFVLGEQSMKSMRGSSGTDLIFKGSKTLPKSSRASVTVYFDNSDKVFKLASVGGENINLNYDVVSISREVDSLGLNKYILNGEEVRLKDINNLLASVNIGSSGHHIISQGEADRILNANAKDRKEMLEDALGLKIYQYKIKESERKLERTEDNMKEISLLRRENAPHLNFLKKQMEKLERAKEMRDELSALYVEYFKKENIYLEKEKKNLSLEKNIIEKEISIVLSRISDVAESDFQKGSKKIEDLRIMEQKLNEIRGFKNDAERKLGRNEGMLEAKKDRVRLPGKCPFCGSEIKEIEKDQIEKKQNEEKELTELKNSQAVLVAEIQKVKEEETKVAASAENLKKEISKEMETMRDLEREKFAWKVKYQELSSALNFLQVREENLSRETLFFENEVKEGVALVGSQVLSFKDLKAEAKSAEGAAPVGGQVSPDVSTETFREESRKKIERLKIKLEDTGLGNGAELFKEFKEMRERDEFLAKETKDLEKSMESLVTLIDDLKEKIDVEFKEGVKKVNMEFGNFFSLMFGGGTAHLSIVIENKKKKYIEQNLDDESTGATLGDSVESEIVFEQGIEINVSLPRKKVKELNALSGGERSLTSIALLFAMSQVHPPPFLVLDETDAALDESNSRKYGDMLERLSSHSELIVVTHNRETMSRAGILYGVTVGQDGASKLLSVRLDEATAIAK